MTGSRDTTGTAARMVGLDLLRFVAIALVLGRHLWPPPGTWPAAARAVLDMWRRGGWVGVDLFFVLSGFLISGLLFNEFKTRGRISPVRFYIRRGWKIYPPFFVLIGVTVALSLAVGRFVGWPRLIREVLFLQSYFPRLWGHTWSLAVEEHFYLLLPLLLVLVLRMNRGSSQPLQPLLGIGAGIAIVTLLLRWITWVSKPAYDELTHFAPTHLRLDSLFFGVVISYLFHFHRARFVELARPWRFPLIGAGVMLLGPAFALELETTPFVFTIGLTVFYIGSGMLMVGVLMCDIQENRVLRPLAAIGVYSYSIYLWHLPVLRLGVPFTEMAVGRLGFGVRAVLYLAGSLVVGVAMAKLVEVPSLRLRERWFPPRSEAPPLGPQESVAQVADEAVAPPAVVEASR